MTGGQKCVSPDNVYTSSYAPRVSTYSDAYASSPIMPRVSTYSARGRSIAPSYHSRSQISQKRVSVFPDARVIDKRNGLDNEGPELRSFGLQTCTDTAVGDCPAHLNVNATCHQMSCPLCREARTCGPNFQNCPYSITNETQTDPICNYSQLPCQCSAEPCGIQGCKIVNSDMDNMCPFSGVECRCVEKSCNTSRQCIVMDEEIDATMCPFSLVECRCIDRGCGTTRPCDIYDEEELDEVEDFLAPTTDDFYGEPLDIVGSSKAIPGQRLFSEDGRRSTYKSRQSKAISTQGYYEDEIINKCRTLCRQPEYIQQGTDLNKASKRRFCKDPENIFPKNCGCGGDSKRKPSCRRKGKLPSQVDLTSGDETEHYVIVLDEEHAISTENEEKSSSICQKKKICTCCKRLNNSPKMHSISRVASSSQCSVVKDHVKNRKQPESKCSRHSDIYDYDAPMDFALEESLPMPYDVPQRQPSATSLRKKTFCTTEDNFDRTSIISDKSYQSRRHSAFSGEPLVSELGVVAPMVTVPEDIEDMDNHQDLQDQDYEINIEDVALAEGRSGNRISIRSGGTRASRAQSNQRSKSIASTRSSPVPRYSTAPSTFDNRRASSKVKPPSQRSIARSSSRTSHKSILSGRPSVRSLGGESNRKSQVHFDIDILDDNANDRTIVLRRSVQQNTIPVDMSTRQSKKSVMSNTDF